MHTPRETAKPAAASRKMFLWFAFRVACSMPRVSGMDDAHWHGIWAHHIFLSSRVVRCMRVWSLPALLSEAAGRRPKGGTLFGKAAHTYPLRHPSHSAFLCSWRKSARCARTAPNSPRRAVSKGRDSVTTDQQL
jgi:hypothetical protein